MYVLNPFYHLVVLRNLCCHYLCWRRTQSDLVRRKAQVVLVPSCNGLLACLLPCTQRYVLKFTVFTAHHDGARHLHLKMLKLAAGVSCNTYRSVRYGRYGCQLCYLRNVKLAGHLRANLCSVAVYSHLAEEQQVVVANLTCGSCERLARAQRVASGKSTRRKLLMWAVILILGR